MKATKGNVIDYIIWEVSWTPLMVVAVLWKGLDAWADLKIIIFLALECWDYRHASRPQTKVFSMELALELI